MVMTMDNFIIPNYQLSYCSLRYTNNDTYGCSSPFLILKGIVMVVLTENDLEQRLNVDFSENIILLLPSFLFSSKRIMTMVLDRPKIVGVVVFLPPIMSLTSKIHFFTELPNCISNNLITCSSKIPDLYSEGYLYHHWKLSVILMKENSVNFNKIWKCYLKYNENSLTDERCVIQINNYYSKYMTYEYCTYLQNSWHRNFWLVQRFEYCQGFTGYNIYITFNEIIFYKLKSVILIYVQTDTSSMFDTAAFGTQELYPKISSMIYMSNVFREAAAQRIIDNHSDILLAFVDNMFMGETGAIRLYYDLKMKKISNSKHNISDRNIKLIIYLGELYTIDNVLTIVTAQCERFKICQIFKQSLIKSASKNNILLRGRDRNSYSRRLRMWKYIPVPIIELKSSLRSRNLFRSSFMDKDRPKGLKFLKQISDTIALSLLEIVISDEKKDMNFDFPSTTLNPKDIALCLFNISCQYLNDIIGPKEKWLYHIFANPFIAQSFSNEIISIKELKYYNRLSAFVLKLLVVFSGHSRSEIENCKDFNDLNYFETTINDDPNCFLTKIQVERNFKLKELSDYSNINISFVNWLRLSLYRTQSFIIYVSPDNTIQNILIVMNTIFTVLCLLGTLYLNRQYDNLFQTPQF